MASIRPEEITDILRQELEKFEKRVDTEHVGTVLQVGDGIARVYGLPDCQMGELLEFPGGRHLTFTVGTQISAHQRVTIVGDQGRIEVMIPFNAPPDRPTEIAIDDGADLFGGGRRVETFPVCDQYALQGDAFSRAVRDGSPLEYGIEDAIANMRVIDALNRSAESGRWETP